MWSRVALALPAVVVVRAAMDSLAPGQACAITALRDGRVLELTGRAR